MAARLRTILLFTAILALVVVPATGAALTFVLGPTSEQLVEGHTVFTVIQPTVGNTTSVRFAAAVAVLVREFNSTLRYARFPGVLWFNDQYLVSPGPGAPPPQTNIMYPCGAAMAVRSGDPDPRLATFDSTTYNESYLITDPNNHMWSVDKWIVNGNPVWTVPLMNNDAGYGNVNDTSQCGIASGQGFTYNAVLYFWLDDLTISGFKDHSVASTDVNGCQQGAYNYQSHAYDYPCPGGNDDNEGNSHPYNPGGVYRPGGELSQNSTARGNHGGSADCNGDGQPDYSCHATANVDIYYGAGVKPVTRNYTFQDFQGSTAPYYCEPTIKTCDPQEWNDQNLQDGGSSGLPVFR